MQGLESHDKEARLSLRGHRRIWAERRVQKTNGSQRHGGAETRKEAGVMSG